MGSLRMVLLQMLLAWFWLPSSLVWAEQATGVVERTGDKLPLDAVFTDHTGKAVPLGALIDRPTLLLPVYYTCPQICSFDLANLALALNQTSTPHDSFNIITLSFNPLETARDAAKAQKNYTSMLEGTFPTENWYFLTGTETAIKRVTDGIGYSFRRGENDLFIHPSAMVALAADAMIIKYIYGSFLVGDVDLALSEAAAGKPATSIKRFLAYCLTGDIGRNELVFRIMKTAIILLLVAGGWMLFRLLLKPGEPGKTGY